MQSISLIRYLRCFRFSYSRPSTLFITRSKPSVSASLTFVSIGRRRLMATVRSNNTYWDEQLAAIMVESLLSLSVTISQFKKKILGTYIYRYRKSEATTRTLIELTVIGG